MERCLSWSGCCRHSSPGPTNLMADHRACRSSLLIEPFAGLPISDRSYFFQVNTPAEQLLPLLLSCSLADRRIVDAYCGSRQLTLRWRLPAAQVLALNNRRR